MDDIILMCEKTNFLFDFFSEITINNCSFIASYSLVMQINNIDINERCMSEANYNIFSYVLHPYNHKKR